MEKKSAQRKKSAWRRRMTMHIPLHIEMGRRAGNTRLVAGPVRPRTGRAAQRTRAGSALSSEDQVVVPIAPSAARPWATWKERTAE